MTHNDMTKFKDDKYAEDDEYDMFIGRERELAAIQTDYGRGRFGFFVLYGRRRVGKTAILKQFIRGRRAVYFEALESNAPTNLAKFRSRIPPQYLAGADAARVPTLSELLQAVLAMSAEQRTVLVIDEFPYMEEAIPDAAGILKDFIDEHQGSSDLYLVLCGSSMRIMLNDVLGGASPLYGRKTGQLRVEPLPFRDCGPFLPGYTERERLAIYGMVGGIPLYLLRFTAGQPLAESIQAAFLWPSEGLAGEPASLLRQEMKEPRTYAGILAAMARGKYRVAEIADASGLLSNATVARLADLEVLGIVQRVTPPFAVSARQTGYVICDQLFAFCAAFLQLPDRPTSAEEAAAVAQAVAAALPQYLGKVFEEVCRQYVRQHYLYLTAGRWWGTDPATKRTEEIDIVACNPYGPARPVLFGECKCRSAPVGTEVLAELRRKAALVKGAGPDRRFLLCSCSGFTDELKAACPADTELVTLAAMAAAGLVP